MRTRKQQRGITLVEILASLSIMTLLTVGITAITLSSVEDSKSQQAALYQSQLGRAVKNWMGNPANRNAIAAAATTTMPVKVTLAQLAQWLPPGFSARNAYRQSPCVMVYFNAGANRLEAAITTEGGDAIDDAQLGYVVTHAGEGAGAIYARAPTIARGAYNSWSTALSNYTTNAASRHCSSQATAGRLVSLLAMDRNGTNALGGAGEWLARNAIPGRPDLNRMNTSIDMNSQDVTNARDLSASRRIASNSQVIARSDITSLEGNIYAPNGSVAAKDGYLTGVTLPSGRIARLSQGVYYSNVVANGTRITKPTTCPTGRPQIFATPVSMSTNPPQQFYATSIVDVSAVATQWRPMLYLFTAGGWVQGNAVYTTLNVWVKCS